MDLGSQAAGIGALADDTRRALYEYVVAQPEPVGREQAATATGVAQHNVNFHLDKLVDEGLLEVEYRRLSGRSGPGAGRPSKLYRRAEREFAVTLPPRKYDLVGGILAEAFAQVGEGAAVDASLTEAAHREGVELARSARLGTKKPLRAVADVLGSQGYQPQVDKDVVTLANCPFDVLAKRHTTLVCGLNRDFVQGVADGLGADVDACLEPEAGRCCVKARRRS
ncbi:MAG: helix-turn-helix domain-containing protein [Nocardioidaceae bacterium]|nr:helix-turn-helix domain-containing protein [Nocardioidaceae bacterium]